MDPNQTQAPGANPQVGSNYSATDGTQLNPTAVTLAKAIRQVESNTDYNAVGDNGQSHGAYQFNKDNFQNWAKQYGLNPDDFSPVNQDKVAYSRINSFLQKGVAPSEVAAIWNGAKYIGGKYQAIQPEYVNKVKSAYQQIASTPQENQQGNQKMLAPGVPALNLGQQGQPQTEDKGVWGNLMSGNLLGAGKDAFNWMFPIVGDIADDYQNKSQKTLLQQLGDAGLSALWFVPGLGEGTGLLGHILEGGAIGYGAGALSSLSQGQGLAQSFSPNASNLIGAATGGVAGGVLDRLSSLFGKNITQEGAINAVKKNLTDTMGATRSGGKLLENITSRGSDPAGLIVGENAIPDIVNGKFSTQAAQQAVKKNLATVGKLRAAILDSSGESVPLASLRRFAGDQVEQYAASGETTKMQAQLDKLFQDYQGSYGDAVTPSQLEAIKEAQAGASGIYKRTGQIGEQNAASIVGNVARSRIEDIASKSGFSGMKELNKLMSEHYDALSLLGKIDGQTVKGGRLGNMLRGHTIAGISALADVAGGGGLFSTLLAGLGGEGANALLSKIMGDTSISNPARELILNSIAQVNPDIIKAAQEFLASKGRLPSELAGQVAARMAPKTASKAPGLISNLLMKSTARGAGGLIGAPGTVQLRQP